jgi:hypothetical protein
MLNEIKAKTETGIDPALRKQLMLKTHLNIQQISADREHVASKIQILAQLIQHSASQVPSKAFAVPIACVRAIASVNNRCAEQNEATKLFCLDLIAQKIVQQGDSQVLSSPFLYMRCAPFYSNHVLAHYVGARRSARCVPHCRRCGGHLHAHARAHANSYREVRTPPLLCGLLSLSLPMQPSHNTRMLIFFVVAALLQVS